MSTWPPVYKHLAVWSCELTDAHIQQHIANGYVWVRPIRRPWAKTLCNPTIGSYLELLSHYDVGAVAITSREGRKLMGRLAVRS